MRYLLLIMTVLTGLRASGQTNDGRLITIPVVFHIIYTDTLPDNGVSTQVRNRGNSTTKLPELKLQAELTDLDRDFQRLNTDTGSLHPSFRKAAGDPRIHFVLQEVKYLRIKPEDIMQRSNSETLHRLSLPIRPEKTLNVYISRLRYRGHGSEGVTGVPTSSIDTTDGHVNLNYKWVGLNYHLLTHEVGHWLGLWHVDDEEQVDGTHVTDIPVQTELTDAACVICTKPSVRVIKRQREQFSVPNTENFMDYSGCRRMFSIQQSAYMRALIRRLRPLIWANSTPSR